MSTIHRVRTSIATDGGTTVTGSGNESGTTEINVDQTFPNASTNTLVTLAITVANIQSFIFLASADTTLKVNSTSSPAPTIALKAGRPLIWAKSDGYYTNLLATNITPGIYVTCTDASRLQMKILTS